MPVIRIIRITGCDLSNQPEGMKGDSPFITTIIDCQKLPLTAINCH
ncbi:hypothetical protein KKB18_06815 [bacterium]|nr:hypothetical protein [bacterium]